MNSMRHYCHRKPRRSCAGRRRPAERRALCSLFAVLSLCLQRFQSTLAWTPAKGAVRSIQTGYQQRVVADPSFPTKSVTEILLAAGTQFAAEWNRRGASRLRPELDFVVAGVLTACYGKFYSMWRVAPTKLSEPSNEQAADDKDATVFGRPVPNNAFQPTMLDGTTVPTLSQRLLSLVAPMPSLFKAGFLASLVGYGLTALGISLRTVLMLNYVAATRNVNVLYVSIYTGAFMAVVSNLRYQILQGVIEPKLVDRLKKFRVMNAITLFLVRMANGLLGSTLAITGIKWLGLQKLKH